MAGGDGEGSVGEDGLVAPGLNNQRPRRRKHAVQLAKPGMGDGSACQPNAARISAEGSMGAWGSGGVEDVVIVLDGGSAEIRKAVA